MFRRGFKTLARGNARLALPSLSLALLAAPASPTTETTTSAKSPWPSTVAPFSSVSKLADAASSEQVLKVLETRPLRNDVSNGWTFENMQLIEQSKVPAKLSLDTGEIKDVDLAVRRLKGTPATKEEFVKCVQEFLVDVKPSEHRELAVHFREKRGWFTSSEFIQLDCHTSAGMLKAIFDTSK
jgi:hypothetical protein